MAFGKELEKVRKKVDKANKQKREIPALEKKVEVLKTKAEAEIKRIPDFTKYEYDGFVNLLEEMKKQSNILITSATYLPPRGGRGRPQAGEKQIPPDVHKVEYDLVCVGGFFPLLRFLNLLETETRFMEVHSADITAIDAGAEENPFLRELRVKVIAYTFNLPKVPETQEEVEEDKPIETTLPPSD